LKETITSDGLHGNDIHQAWKSILKNPGAYVPIDPVSLLSDAKSLVDTKSWLSYLNARYWPSN